MTHSFPEFKNKIVNYYVEPSLKPHVVKSHITIGAKVAANLIEKQLKRKVFGNIFHVCFDVASGMIYTPNAHEFSPEQTELALQAIKMKIIKDYKFFSSTKNINGSPFTSYRKRTISQFEFVKTSVEKHFSKNIHNITIIEANLARMPSTLKTLPNIFTSPNCVGGYISPSDIKKIDFVDEYNGNGKKREKSIFLDSVTTPCIIINTDPDKKIKAYDKEWTVLSGYRDFLYDKSVFKDINSDDLNAFSFIYACKIHMYYGWPFQEICEVLLPSAKTFPELIKAINNLKFAADQLEAEGYPNPAKDSYYYSFKTDKAYFPFKIESLCSEDGKIDAKKQISNFEILEYTNSDFVTIESPIYINPTVCKNLLKSFINPLIAQYNPFTKNIEIKSQGTLKNFEKNYSVQLKKIKFLVCKKYNLDPKKVIFVENQQTTAVSKSDNTNYSLRKISEYYYASDYAKKICKKEGLNFQDIDVLVGPIEQIYGRGTMGGFVNKPSKEDQEKSKTKYPYEIVKGIFVEPPFISINSDAMTGYAEQTETLIHEYRHFIFSKTTPNYKHKYNTDYGEAIKKKDNLQWWDMYLSDIDERYAHKIQLEFQLKSGYTADELISEKVGGVINEDNYPIAMKFKQLIDEVEKEITK